MDVYSDIQYLMRLITRVLIRLRVTEKVSFLRTLEML